MKKRLLFAAALIALVLPLSRKVDAQAAGGMECFEENYGGGNCGTTCVMYNDQGSVEGYCTDHHAC
jgi:hypothetical protein